MIPARSAHHFFVVLPGALGSRVRVYERFHWSAAKTEKGKVRDAELGPDMSPVYKHGQQIEGSDVLRLELPIGKWEKVAKPLAAEFNPRLKKASLTSGKFTTGGIAVAEDLGKEMLVLLWAIKEADPGQIPTAVANWQGFRPEERCWLYTMTNVRHGGLDDHNGWRAALREILCSEESIAPIGDLFGDGHSAIVAPAGRDGVLSPSIDSETAQLNIDNPRLFAKLRTCNKKSFGEVDANGFFLVLPKGGERSFPYVYEGSVDKPIVRVPLYQWREVARDVEDVFNTRLAENKKPKGKFTPGVNALSRLFGKELLILLWTLEQVNKASAPTALRNWKALMPEERWWLYTRAAASPKGWKKALRSALAECGPMQLQGTFKGF